MPFLRDLLIAAVFCSPAFAVYAQSPDWKSQRYGKVSLRYPPTWQVNKETQGEQSRITLTPDSMQRLTMRMIEVYEIPLGGGHTYESFKTILPSSLRSRTEDETKFLKTEEITFKGHKCIYTQMIQNSLPLKVFGIDAGTKIYMFILMSRRYSNIPDPGLDRDGTAILNSVTIDQ